MQQTCDYASCTLLRSNPGAEALSARMPSHLWDRAQRRKERARVREREREKEVNIPANQVRKFDFAGLSASFQGPLPHTLMMKPNTARAKNVKIPIAPTAKECHY